MRVRYGEYLTKNQYNTGTDTVLGDKARSARR